MVNQTILVASQNQPQAKMIGESLTNAGYQVLAVEQGQSALFAIQHQKPDLVILDRKLPDLSAFALTRMIRSNLEGKDLPIILSPHPQVPGVWHAG
jgi:two-component system phosphate regulon response regulator PhoB